MSDLYQTVDVWKRLSDGRVVRYRCFNILSSGKCCVQSSDFYSVPMDPQHMANLEARYLEPLTEEPPSGRSGVFDTLEAAIDVHERTFFSENGKFTT